MKKWSLIDKAFLLKRTFPFESLDLDILLTFADKLTLISFNEGEEIFPAGQEANRMYFIGKGSVNLHSKIEKNLISPDYFGDQALFSEEPRTYGATATSETLLFALSKSHLMMMISEAPVVGHRFLKIYAAQI